MPLIQQIKCFKRKVHSFLFKPHVKIVKGNWKLRFVGGEYGGYAVVEDILPSNPTVLSFGIGEDATFDFGMIEEFDAKVYAFDPTPKAIDYVEHLEKRKGFEFYQYGISHMDEESEFFLPKNKSYVSGSEIMHSGVDGEQKITVPMKKLSTIMNELQIERISVLKMDIEGSEFGVVDDVCALSDRIGQVCLECHYYYFENPKKMLQEFIRKMEESGFELVYKSDNMEVFTFAKVSF